MEELDNKVVTLLESKSHSQTDENKRINAEVSISNLKKFWKERTKKSWVNHTRQYPRANRRWKSWNSKSQPSTKLHEWKILTSTHIQWNFKIPNWSFKKLLQRII